MTVKFLSQLKLSVISYNRIESTTRRSNCMVKEIYSIGGYNFTSAKDLAEFKNSFPCEWEVVSNKPLRKSMLNMDTYNDFVDYLDSLQKMPDICLAYRADNARGYGYYTTVWCNGLEIRGIFGYLESEDIKDHLVYEMMALSKWKGMKIRQNYCR